MLRWSQPCQPLTDHEKCVAKWCAMKNLIYQPEFVVGSERQSAIDYFLNLPAIWEHRYSTARPLETNQKQRMLLRPVYWLGNWQFACLNYYHPPKGVDFRCVEAEPFPDFMQNWVHKIEKQIHQNVPPSDIPRGWHLNTCLINYYGRIKDAQNKWQDVARVGDHKDHEPGPVASVSFGERAYFQFVKSAGRNHPSQAQLHQWLEDGSLQIFSGHRYKTSLFHRVQRVEKKSKIEWPFMGEDFKVRRINLTFRYVPDQHILPLAQFPASLRQDLAPYIAKLAQRSPFFAAASDAALLAPASV